MTHCEQYGHSWAAGRMVVHEEDVLSMSQERDVECDCCGVGVGPFTPRDVAEEIIYGWMD